MSRWTGLETASIPIIELVDAVEDTGFLDSSNLKSGFCSGVRLMTDILLARWEWVLRKCTDDVLS
jgi:hypothetical protein